RPSARPWRHGRVAPVDEGHQLPCVAGGAETVVGNGERLAQLCDEFVLASQVGVRRRDRLELNERAELLNVVEVDTNVLPQKQTTLLGHGNLDAERRGQGCEQRLRILALIDPVATFALLW